MQRVEAERVPDRERCAGGLWRRVRKRQRVQPHHDRGARGEAHRQCLRVGMQHLADDDACDDPADRPQHADRREFAARILHLPERERIAQRQRRHVAERVDEQHGVKSPERRLHRRVEQHSAADHVQRGEDALGREKAVGDHPDEKRRNHRRQRRRPGREPDLLARESQRLPEPRAHRDVPRAPHEILQKHERGQFQANCRRHGWIRSTTRSPPARSGSRATADRPLHGALRRPTRARLRVRCSSRSRSRSGAAR